MEKNILRLYKKKAVFGDARLSNNSNKLDNTC